MAQKIIYWLTVALVLSLGFGQLLRFEWHGATIYVHDFLAFLILSCFLPTLSEKRRRLPHVPAGLKIFGFGLIIGWVRAVTLFPLGDLTLPFLYTIRILAYLGVYLLLKNSKANIPKSAFVVAGVVTLVIGFIQYFLMPDMRVFQYLGWDDHLNRITLPHFDPTFTAVLLVLGVLTVIPTKSIHTTLYSLLAFLGVMLTYARSVWLSLALTGLMFIKNKRILLIAICVAALSIALVPQRFGEGTNLLRTYSISARAEHDLGILGALRLNLLTGVGMNTFAIPTIHENGLPNHATGPNSSYLYVLATTGIIGLIGWGMFLRELYLESLFKPSIAFFLIASLFNNVMFYPFALLFVLLLSLTVPNES